MSAIENKKGLLRSEAILLPWTHIGMFALSWVQFSIVTGVSARGLGGDKSRRTKREADDLP